MEMMAISSRRQLMSPQQRVFAILGIIAGLILVQACGRELPPEQPCNFVQNHNQQRVSWEREVPVEIFLDNSVPSEYESAVRGAMRQWNEVGQSLRGRDFFKLGANSPGANQPAQDGYTKIYFLNTWEADKPSEQARTTVYWTGSKIFESDIRINDKNFNFYLGDNPDFSKVHLESLIVHELGHVLGLAHTGEENSVMQVTLANGKSRTEPGGIDINSIQCEY